MKKTFSMFVALSAVMLLTQCVYKDTPYSFRAPTKEQKCLSKCQVQERECVKLCTNTAEKCNLKANHETRVAYNRYLHQQIIAGKPVARDYASYYDPLKCSKVTCNCFEDAADCDNACKV